MSYIVPNSSRSEIKFVGDHSSFDSVFCWLQLSQYGFYKEFPDRKVNSIYFDSIDYSAFIDNLIGLSARSKLRIRWYGDFSEQVRFELKRKRNSFGWKIIENIDMNSEALSMNVLNLKNNIRNYLSDQNKYFIDIFSEPSLKVQYDRQYFISLDGNVRVTIDTNQSFTEMNSKLASKKILNDMFIVEFKFGKKAHHLASDIISTFPLRQSKNSKYVNGVYGYLK